MLKIDEKQLVVEKKNSNKSYPLPKWIQFCELMLQLGFKVELYKAMNTRSKYVFITKNNITRKIRFSNHKPAYTKQKIEEDSDYYVGVSHSGVITTEKLIEVIKEEYSL